tara:strand:+ start:192 stop:1064 length:873 start_codon:yes stop_codon:yes gene_type:complete
MKTLKIGSIFIDRLVESESASMDPNFLFPEANLDSISSELNWLEPYFFDNSIGKLIMSFHTYVIKTNNLTILVDTCVGNNKCRPNRPFWHQLNLPYLKNLKNLGVHPDEVDYVLCTHLHSDHVGWNTKLENGMWVPTFPNAKYIFAKSEYNFWENAAKENPEVVNHGAFADSVLPVMQSGQAVLVDSDHSINNNIFLEPAPGHTPGNVIINIQSQGDKAILCGDTIHHPIQLSYPEWSSRFCEDKNQSFLTRKRLLEQIADTHSYILPAHFPFPTVGKIILEKSKFKLKI